MIIVNHVVDRAGNGVIVDVVATVDVGDHCRVIFAPIS